MFVSSQVWLVREKTPKRNTHIEHNFNFFWYHYKEKLTCYSFFIFRFNDWKHVQSQKASLWNVMAVKTEGLDLHTTFKNKNKMFFKKSRPLTFQRLILWSLFNSKWKVPQKMKRNQNLQSVMINARISFRVVSLVSSCLLTSFGRKHSSGFISTNTWEPAGCLQTKVARVLVWQQDET